MQEGNNPLSTVTAGSSTTAVQSPRRENRDMFDSVKADPTTIVTAIFLGSEERKEFVPGQNIPHNQKKQQYTKDGVPIWTVKLYATNWRGLERQIKVNVPQSDDPAGRFAQGELVALSDLEFGVTPKREGGGFVIWMKASGIRSDAAAGERRKPTAVGSAA